VKEPRTPAPKETVIRTTSVQNWASGFPRNGKRHASKVIALYCDIVLYVSYHIISYLLYYIISYHIMSYHIIVISYHCHIISRHIISYHIISCHVISYHINIITYTLIDNHRLQTFKSQKRITIWIS